MAYLLGCYLGDGCSYTRISVNRSTYQFSITSEDRDLCENCQVLIEEVFQKKNSKIKTVPGKSGNVHYQLVACSKPITTFFADWTQGREIIPDEVYQSREMLRAFSQGLMDTDGWISKTHPSDGYIRYRIGFKNTLPWVEQFRQILISLGVNVGVLYPAKVKVNEKPAMAFTVNTRSFCELINFRIHRKIGLVQEYLITANKRGSKKNLQLPL